MKSAKNAVTRRTRIRRQTNRRSENTMRFPHAPRNAIPDEHLPGCDRALILSSIDASVSRWHLGGLGIEPQVQLNFRVEESGKLTGIFDVSVSLQVEAARAFAATLQELVARIDSQS
jgi:hypothetical protein